MNKVAGPWIASVMLGGRKVVVDPLFGASPRIKIPDDFPWCSDAYRAKHNKWLLDRFGATQDRMAISEDDRTVFISPGRARALGLREFK